MIKKLIILFLSAPLMAEGPILQHADKYVNQEFQNVYNDVRRVSRSSLMGITDGSSACAGCVGEYKETYDTGGGTPAPTSGTYGNGLSLSLTAGHWVVYGVCSYNSNTGSISSLSCGVSSDATSTTFSDSAVQKNYSTTLLNPVQNAIATLTVNTPAVNINISSTTTYYLKVNVGWTGSAPAAYLSMKAFRIQ